MWLERVAKALSVAGAVVIALASFYRRPLFFLVGATIYGLSFLIDYIRERRQARGKAKAIRELLKFLVSEFLGESSHHRATILLPDRKDNYIRPKYRFQYGESATNRLASKAKFRKGTALAGFAWEDVSKVIKPEGGDIPEFKTDEEFYKYYKEEFKMPRELIDCLSNRMRSVRSIRCYGLCNHRGQFIGVLSIDSTEAAAFGNFDISPGDKFTGFIGVIEALLEEL